MDDHNDDYFPVDGDDAGGWLPIGDETSPFVAVFDGNTHTISNLAIRRDQTYIGLFGVTVGGIRNLGLVDNLADYTGSSYSDNYIGGLVGYQDEGSITASYATGDADGGNGSQDRVGGLVGLSYGSITASYATGDADGGDGYSDSVGGLVGYQGSGSSITASYATGDADGGDGDNEEVGGLVGQQYYGLITASYATGDADGGDGDYDSVGGLVGYQYQGLITASYATGDTDGGDGDYDSVGGLVGLSYGSITASYGFGGTIGGEFVSSDGSTKPQGVSTAAQLTADPANAGAAWNNAVDNTLGAWDFGTDEQIPALNYADYDGVDLVFDCNQFPANACGTLLPGQRGGGSSPVVAADRDGNGLIEIDSLLMLHNMRHNLAGTSYKTSTASVGNSFGCPATGCIGYELTRNLDFDVDGDGSTWSGNSDPGYSLDSEDSQADYFPVDGDNAGGWLPIGDETSPFVAVFDGNGHKISNLAIRRDQIHVGLFGAIGSGAAIRNLGLVDNLADYTGSSSSGTYIGGLVGLQNTGSSITASYATGDADGGGGSDSVGGLVGSQQGGGLITASYATGDTDGQGSVGGLVGSQQGGGLITASYATGDTDGQGSVGGLVGSQSGGGLITASYATGDAHGGDGNNDNVGGLVGWQFGGSTTASYATGDADGGDGYDYVGGLVGRPVISSITASYGFGGTIGGESAGSDGSTKPQGVSTAAQLTAANAGPDWNSAVDNTLGAWDFGTNVQIPALNYADYDGAGTVFDCNQFPAGACGTQFPRQAKVNATGLSAVVLFGTTTTITGSLVFGRVAIESWSWEQLQGPKVTLMGADTRTATFRASATGTLLLFELTATDSEGRQHTDRISLAVFDKVADRDGDGLIEIDSLLMFHNMRHNLAGTSYKTSIASVGNSIGCPDAGCRGYELTRNLDFDVNGDGSTWSGNGDVGYSLDSGDSQADYFPVDGDDAGGWSPIGDETNPFGAVFDGNGHKISNLAIRRDQTYVGLFGVTGSGAAIRNLGLVDNLADYTGSSDSNIFIGGLVGFSRGSITASYATGDADGGDVSHDSVGGLVGQSDGSITASYATGDAHGGDGPDAVGGLVGFSRGLITASYAKGDAHGGDVGYDSVGGLVGRQEGGSITASYATGDADGQGRVGGLVGRQQRGSITASHATGDADGGDGYDYVGGLVGLQEGGSITASYATGDAHGGDGDYDRVGGLVGQQSGSGGLITASHATGDADGGDGDQDLVGGLVGYQVRGSITASYATGDAEGGDGNNDYVGGLVGLSLGSITASYATGDADGGVGQNDSVGGLVGWQREIEASITASYATGDADGGDGDDDQVGGLVGYQSGGSITASYATGDADGGDGLADDVGGLVGYQSGGPITASYGFGGTIGGESVGLDGSTKPQGVSTAAQLTTANAGATWNSAVDNSLGAWDFGTNEQIPVLNYADYDGAGTVFDCNQFPANACGTQLPRQADVNATGLSAVAFGATTTITGSLVFGRVAIESWSWEQLQGPTVTLMGADTRTLTFRAPATGTFLLFELIATDSGGEQYTDRILLFLGASVDHDGNGLIEIDSLAMLHNMRYNLAGTSYKESDNAPGAAYGCPAAGCLGYELTRDLDFDVNGDGSTWSRNHEGSYTLDVDDHNDDYFPVDGDDAGGWLPIGDETNTFAAVFDGNGHTISNLVIRRDQAYIGLFGAIGSGAAIRNLGLVNNLADYTGSSDSRIYIGGLVGYQDSGSSITASYATGDAHGGDGDYDRVGGLVGYQEDGSITASYATGDADGGDGDYDRVGGLVGRQEGGSITASYATGDAGGGDGYDYVGGLVGWQRGGSITASYATGDAHGGDGDYERVGGLVGQSDASITASYATGDAHGGDGDYERVGGLVGYQNLSSITASYATGDADGGDGDYDRVGGLVGLQRYGSITASYATGDADGGDGDNDDVGGLVGYLGGGSITASYATGDADGGDGDSDFVGGLVGFGFGGSITTSYGFGGTIGGELGRSDGSTKPQGVSTAAQLTADNAGSAWNDADSNTLGAWDFGTNNQVPVLNYADYDGAGNTFDCSQFPTGACGTLLPGRLYVSLTLKDAAAGVNEGTRVTLSAELSSAVANETVVRLVVVAGGQNAADDADIVIKGDVFSVTIAAGAVSGTTEFTVLDDDIDEEDETLVIDIAEGDLISDQIIEVTIRDDDTRGVKISPTSLNLTEGESGTYSVVLTSQPNAGNVTVTLASSDPARVRIEDISNLVFSAENWHITRTVQIITSHDTDRTDNEVEITHKVMADGDYAEVNAVDVDVVVVTVEEGGGGTVNLTLTVAPTTVAEGTEVTLSAELSSAVANETVVRLVVVAGGQNAADDADIVIKGDVFSVTIAAGATLGTTEFTVLDDDIDEGTETLVIDIAAGGDIISDQIIEVTIRDDDTRGVKISPTSLNLTEGESGAYSVVLTSQPNTGSVTVTLASSDPDRVSIDNISNLVFSAENWHITRTVQIITSPDTDGTDNEVEITHKVTADGDYAEVNAVDVDVVVVTVEEGGGGTVNLTLTVAPTTVAEGTEVTLSAELSSAVANETVVRLVIVAGGPNAADDADIVIKGDVFSVTIAAGATLGTTEFTVLDDDIDEEDETLVIDIAAGGDIISDQIIEVTIRDDDTRGVEISPTSLNLTEGESGTYTVVLTSQPNAGSVTVIAASSDPARVSIDNISNLVFSAENWHITRTVQIITSHDTDGTDNEVEITHKVMADGDYAEVNAVDVVVVTVEEGGGGTVNLTLTVAPTTVAEGTEVTLSAELSSAVANDTVVRLVVVAGGQNAADDADIVIKGDVFSVTIAAGATLGTTEFTVLDDDIDEEDETLVIDIAAGGDIISDQIIEVTIRDDDTRGVEISPTSLNLTEGESGTYTVVLTSQPNAGNVTVTLASSDPDRVSIDNISNLVFSAENWHITRTVQIITSHDTDGTDNEVEITHKVMADGDYAEVNAVDVDVVVVTVEEGGGGTVNLTLTVAPTTVAEGTEVTLSAELSSAVANETVVRLVVVAGGPNAADDADIVIKGDVFSVTIAAGVASGTTTFTVLDDDIDEEDETLVIDIAAGGDIISDQIIEVTIRDDDTRGVKISPTSLNLTEGESGTYTVVLTSQPNAGSVTVIPASSDPDRVSIDNISNLVFSAENWHITRTVQIITSHDTDGTDNEVEITHKVMADGDYAEVNAVDVVVVTVEEGGGGTVNLTLTVAPTTVAEGTEVTLSAELSSAVANDTVVRLVVVAGGQNAADDADIVIKGDVFSVTIAAGAVSGTTTFTVLDDDIDEEDEILMIDIAEGDLISAQIIEVTIRDDDTRGVEISPTSLNLTEGESGAYSVVLTSQPNAGNVTVIAASSDPDRVSIDNISNLVFSAENWHITRTVQIITSPDTDGTDNEVEITHKVTADGDYAEVNAVDVDVVVVTVEEGGGGTVNLTLTVAPTTVAEGTEVTLSAELSSAVANETVVRLVIVAGGPNAADDADIVIKGDVFSVTIAAGVASGTTTFTVLDDDIDEGTETLMIDIAEGDLISDQIIEVTIRDDDTRGVEISPTSLNLTEGESGAYSVVLTSQPNTGSVTVIAASSDPDRVRIDDISDLVFSAENWHIPQIVQIITFPDPDGTDPDGTDPDGTDPDGTDPDGTDPDGTDPEVRITHQVVADVDGDYGAGRRYRRRG